MGAVVADYLCSCLKAASLNQILKFGPCRVDLGNYHLSLLGMALAAIGVDMPQGAAGARPFGPSHDKGSFP